MSWSRDRGPRGYHHGNLKEALIQAALDLIARKGPAGFTFAEAARWAGVSPAAPYRHFRDRDELLASVALRGFEQFAAALARAWDDGRPERTRLLLRHVRGRYPARYQPGPGAGGRASLCGAADRDRGAGRHHAGAKPAADRLMALHIWSLSHGIASLFARGDAARRALPMPAEDLL